MTTEPLPDIATTLLLTSGREQMRTVLAFLSLIPEAQRPLLRAGCMHALNVIEDVLEVERTFPDSVSRRHKERAKMVCACGCGKVVSYDAINKRYFRYHYGHTPKESND